MTRFIDLATDGGCAKKADAAELERFLQTVAQKTRSPSLASTSRTFPDVGRFQLGAENGMATIDVLFPMVPDPTDFGRIVVNHVLGDVYAAFGTPRFALSVVGVPYGIELSGEEVTAMMTASIDELSRTGAVLVGGHTLAKQADLSLGFCIIAQPMVDRPQPLRDIGDGDPIFLTKPLGTSIASLLWKQDRKFDANFDDVRKSMLETSLPAAQLLHGLGVTECTDVTGYGLINHLHRLLIRLGVSAEIVVEQLPTFSTIEKFLGEDCPATSLYFHNSNFASQFVDVDVVSRHAKAVLLFDAQVAGGLLFALPVENVSKMRKAFFDENLQIYEIGRCRKDVVGKVTFL